MKRFFLYFFILLIVGGGVFLFVNRNSETQTSTEGSFFKNFFSRDTNPVETTADETSPVDEALSIPEIPESSPFNTLSSFPIAGYTVFYKTTPKTTLDEKGFPVTTTTSEKTIRYVSRKNGYIYETTDGKSALQISNIFIPNIYEAFFSKDGKSALVRFLRDDNKTIASYIIPIPDTNPDGTRTQKQGIYLPENITALTTSPQKDTLSYIQKTTSGVSVHQTDFVNKNNKEVFKSEFESWLPIKTNSASYIQTKASGLAEGFLYQINDKTKTVKKLLGNILGLTVSIDPKGEYVLYSQTTESGFITKIYTIKTGGLVSIGLPLLPEKCVWLENQDLLCSGTKNLENGLYPDGWYAGTLSFSDSFYKIYTKTGLYDPIIENVSFEFDAINLSVDEQQSTLYFIDKKTGVLWSFDYR